MSLLRTTTHRSLGPQTGHIYIVTSPIGLIVAGCPRKIGRRLTARGGPSGPRTNAHDVAFKHRLCVRHNSFGRINSGSFCHLSPNNHRIHLGDTCVVRTANYSGSRGNGMAAMCTACSTRSGSNATNNGHGIGDAVG